MQLYRLHGFSQSGNTFKVAFLLRTLGLPWEPVFVDFMHGVDPRSANWRDTTNEMGEVPILVEASASADKAGRSMTQSGVILTHLAQQARFERSAGQAAKRKRPKMCLRWLFFDNHKFTSYFATYRFMKAFGPSAPDPAVMAWLRTRLDNAFGIVDKHLAGRRFMVGEAPTIADISLSGYLFYPVEESGYPVAGPGSPYPNIAAWIERLRALPGWASPYDILPGAIIAPRW